MADNINHDELVAQLVDLTGASPADAQRYLEANQWDLGSAATEYFTALEEGATGAQQGAEDPQETEPYTGPRTLDGRPAPTSAIPTVGSSSRGAAPPKRGGFATLDSLGSGTSGGHGHGHAHDDDDESDDDDSDPREQPRDLFAGGEKSGLAVQDPTSRNDPRRLVNDILKKARSNAAKPEGEEPAATSSRFHGSGQTLGGDDTPSQTIPDSNPRQAAQAQHQTRTLHLWEDGFSVEDGPLHRFDDPQNAQILQMIRQGHAPLHLMGVRPDEPVDVQLNKHDEKYKPPPKVYKPFSGGGQRLGSPTPGGPAVSQPPASTAPPTTAASSTNAEPEIDSSQPTVSLRIQLANGTRLPARFNDTHTIGDLYEFIERAYPDSSERQWVLATTFPNKNHTDRAMELKDVAEFRKGGTAVQKWV